VGFNDLGEVVGDGWSLGCLAEGVLAIDATVEGLLANLRDAGSPTARKPGNLILGLSGEETLDRESQRSGVDVVEALKTWV
jgi:hypothetical protein